LLDMVNNLYRIWFALCCKIKIGNPKKSKTKTEVKVPVTNMGGVF
jgi:hypothetical protein